jgi:serine/threonine-protein kinase RsbW
VVGRLKIKIEDFSMSKNKSKTKKMTIHSNFSELEKIREFVQSAALSFGFSEDDAFQISLAVDEAITNLIKYSFRDNSQHNVTIEINPQPNEFEVNILDKGAPFDPMHVPSPDMEEYMRKYQKGGLGIHIMRSVMDKISYHPSNKTSNTNVLKLTKILSLNNL